MNVVVNLCMCMCVWTCVWVYVCVCVWIFVSLTKCVCLDVCVFVVVGTCMQVCIYSIYIYIYIYIYMAYTQVPPPLDPSVRLAAGLGTPPPYFEVGKHKKMGFGVEWYGGRAVYRVFGLKIGYGITAVRMLTTVLKITTES